MGQDPVDLPDVTNFRLIDLYVDTDVQFVKPKNVHRDKDKSAAAKRKCLKRRIPTLEVKVDSLWKKGSLLFKDQEAHQEAKICGGIQA